MISSSFASGVLALALTSLQTTQEARPGAAQSPSGGDQEVARTAAPESVPGFVQVRLPESPLDEDTSSWTGVITGTLVDVSGAPIQGATIVSANRAPRTVSGTPATTVGRAHPGHKALEESLADHARAILRARLEERLATTDADGRFRLEGLRPGSHNLQVYAEGFVCRFARGETGAEVSLVGRPVFEIPLDLRLPDGSPCDEALLIVKDQQGERFISWTRSAPGLRTEKSSFELTVHTGNVERVSWNQYLSDSSVGPVPVTAATPREEPLRLDLTASQLLRVTVADASTLDPRLPLWIKVRPIQAEGRGPEWSDRREVVELKEESAGSFARALGPGRYEIAVGRLCEEPVTIQAVTVERGLNEVQIQLAPEDRKRFYVLHCTAPDGTPVSGARIGAAAAREGQSTRGGAHAVERRPGEYWVPRDRLVFDPQRAPLTGLELWATTASLGTAAVQVDLDRPDVELRFESPVPLTIDAGGAPRDGCFAKLQLLDSKSYGPVARLGRTPGAPDAPWTAHFPAVQPGRYRLTVERDELPASASNTQPILTRELTVGDQAVHVAIEVPPLYTLRVDGKSLPKSGQLTMERIDLPAGHPVPRLDEGVDSAGFALFQDLPPGRYKLRSYSQPRGVMTVEIPRDVIEWDALEWDPEEIDSILVTRVFEGGVATSLGVQNGDLIVAIDGEPIGSMDSFGVDARPTDPMYDRAIHALHQRARTRTFTVERDGRPFEITVEAFGESESGVPSLGCTLWPHGR